MRPGVHTFNYSDARNELAWLVLRVVETLGPCTGASLIAYISGDYTTSESPRGQTVLNALLRLKALGFIQSTEEQIGITDGGRWFLDQLAVDRLSPRTPYIAFTTALVPTSEHIPQLKRFCRESVARARAVILRGFRIISVRQGDMRGCALLIGSRGLRAEAWGIFPWIWRKHMQSLLWKAAVASEPTLKAMLTSPTLFVIFCGALLVVALSTAGGFAFLSGKRGESPQLAPIAFDARDRPSSPASVAETDAPATQITRTEAIRVAIRDRLSKLTSASEPRKREQGALVEYYSVPTQPLLWVDDNGLTDRAESVMAEIARADDYGLHAADYELPKPDGFNADDHTAVNWLADTEVKISFAVLRYARDARGGRIVPSRLTKNLSPTLALPELLDVLGAIAINADPAAYLRSFHPRQPQFEALRQKLPEIRRQAATSKPIIIIPDGPVLKKGVEHEQVVLLRKRLEVSLDSENDKLYDDFLDEAVRTFQKGHGVTPDGVVGAVTRRILNQPGDTHLTQQRLILLNMERWRWLPNDLGPFYVSVNVPEFMARVVKEGAPIYTTRVVVGKPDKQTPTFSDEMQEVVFNPFWSVPTSIKVEEIRPYLRQEMFFGGWNTSVFRRHGLRIRYGGKEVDPGAIDWNHADIRNLEIFQPPGPDNVLGKVKFVFPNKHDVYMHDTTQKELFAKAIRAESHGCVRVQNPDELAAILLDYDQGWSGARVESAIQNGYDQHVALSRKIPVHITYFTLWVNHDGSMSKFGDLYGHDARMAASLFGGSEGFRYPKIARVSPLPRGNSQAPGDEPASNDIVGSIIRLLEN